MTRTIAIDFDGTLCELAWPGIGIPKLDVIAAAKREKASGSDLILWTNREGKLLDDAIEWCAQLGLTFDAINDSTEEWKKHFDNNPRKVGADEYWDDKAVTIK